MTGENAELTVPDALIAEVDKVVDFIAGRAALMTLDIILVAALLPGFILEHINAHSVNAIPNKSWRRYWNGCTHDSRFLGQM